MLKEITSDIFFSKSTSVSSTAASSKVKSEKKDEALRQNDSDSDCDNMHGISCDDMA